MTGREDRRIRWLVALGCAALLFSGLGRLPLLDPDEGRYAQTAREMLERGDLVVPRLDGEPRLQKPALFYWLEIAAFSLLGPSELAARLPSAAAGAGTLLWLYLFARRRAGERAALLACAILATTPLFFALARAATTDMVLTFFVFGATASLYAGIVEPVRRTGHLWAGGLCLGLGLLTKGPVVLLVPALVVAAGAVARRRAPITVAGRAVAVAWIMVAVALPWAALLFARVGAEEVLEIWRREALERLASGVDHPETALYLFMTAPATFFPWSALVPLGLAAAVRRARRGDAWWPALLAWSLGPFLFWTFSRGKLDSYLLPQAPGVALLLASALSFRDEGSGEREARWAVGLLVVGASLALLPFPLTRMVRSAPAALASVSLAAAALAMAVAATSFAGRPRAVPRVLAALTGSALLAGALLVPVDWAERRSTRALLREAGASGGDEPVHLYRLLAPGLGFYAERPVVRVPARHRLLALLEAGRGGTVVLEERRHRAVTDLLRMGFRVVSRSGDLVLMRRRPPADPDPARRSRGGRPPGRLSSGRPPRWRRARPAPAGG